MKISPSNGIRSGKRIPNGQPKRKAFLNTSELVPDMAVKTAKSLKQSPAADAMAKNRSFALPATETEPTTAFLQTALCSVRIVPRKITERSDAHPQFWMDTFWMDTDAMVQVKQQLKKTAAAVTARAMSGKNKVNSALQA